MTKSARSVATSNLICIHILHGFVAGLVEVRAGNACVRDIDPNCDDRQSCCKDHRVDFEPPWYALWEFNNQASFETVLLEQKSGGGAAMHV